MSRLGRLRLSVVLLASLATLLAIGLSACGGGDSSSSTSSGGGGESTEAAGGGGEAEGGGAEGEEEGGEAEGGSGNGAEAEGKTVGFVNIVPNEASEKAENAFKEAAGVIGWKVVQGSRAEDVITAEESVQNLLNQHVDAIVMQSVDPATLGESLKRANEEEVPIVIQENGTGYAYLYDGQILAMPDWDFSAQGSVLSTFFIRSVLEKTEGKDAEVIVFTGLPTLPSQQLWLGALESELKWNPQVKVVAKHSVDYTKPGEDISSFLEQELKAHPDVVGIFTAANLEAPAAVGAVEAAGKTGDIVITSLFADKDLLELIRQEKLTGIVDVPVEKGSWQSADALVDYFTGRPVDKNQSLTDPLQPKLIDKTNVPPKGQEVEYPPFKPDFLKAWCTDGIKGACSAE
jgi:ABC-type sugar transport system substrate-binding protein